jgi:hypothetical protein
MAILSTLSKQLNRARFVRSSAPRRRRAHHAELALESLEARQVLSVMLGPIGGYETDIFNQGAAEGVGYSVAAERLFVANQSTIPATATTPEIGPRIDVVDASDPHNPIFEFSIDVSAYGAPTTVATFGNLVAVAIPNGTDETLPGVVMFLDAHDNTGIPLRVIQVGPVPDHVVFTPDGTKVLTANEGQRGTTVDPEGSISVIDVSQGVANAAESKIGFDRFNSLQNVLVNHGVRFLPDRPVAQSIEPEYIAVHPNSTIAWVALQENSAIAQINLQSGEVNWVKGLGYKDHSLPGNGLDPSDRDGGNFIGNWPVLGSYQPDGVTAFSNGNDLYLATANEGDGFGGESVRASSLNLDDTTFPNEAALKTNAQLGRLNVSGMFGDTDGDGDVDKLYSFGGRSFSIWTPDVQQVFDSGDDLEQITASAYPANFNASNTVNTRDDRSDDRGPEPTTVVVGEVAGHKYLFLTVERTGGIMVYNVDLPSAPTFVQYVNTRDFSQTPGPGTGGDLHPENLVFVPADKSPTDKPLLVVSYQVSGSVRIFEIDVTAAATPLAAATSAALSDQGPTIVQPHRPHYHATTDVSGLAQPTRRIARRNDKLLAAATDKAIERLSYGFSSRHAKWGSLESSLDEVVSGLVPAFRGARATV